VAEFSSHLQTNIKTFSERHEADEFQWQKLRVEKICSILRKIPQKAIVADLGCMSGMASAWYAACGVQTLHGFDVSEASLDRLRAKGFEGHPWNVDGERCPMPDGTYDVVIAGEIIEHVVNTDAFAQELYRILKPNGVLILSTPNLASWYNRIRLLRGLPPRSYPGVSSSLRKDALIDNNHIRVNVLSEWIYFLESHRFRVKEVYGTSHLAAVQGGWRNRIIHWIDGLASKKPSLAVGLILKVSKAP